MNKTQNELCSCRFIGVLTNLNMFEKIKIVVFLSIVFIGDSMFAQDYNLAYIGH